jgi:dihydrofolate reductase
LCIIGGASIYELFRNDIEKWFVTEIQQTVEDADTFMPADYLQDFTLQEMQTLEDGLPVKVYEQNK